MEKMKKKMGKPEQKYKREVKKKMRKFIIRNAIK